jgi:hypothetical protein
MGSRGGLYFPIKLRCADLSGLSANPALESAISRALGRSFARARATLPPELAFGDGVVLEDACLTGTVPLGAEDQNALLEVVNRAIAHAAHSHAVPRPLDSRAHGRAGATREDAGERFDPRRYGGGALGTYDLPSYRGGTQKVRLKHSKNPFQRLVMLYEPCITALNEIYLAAEPNHPNANWTVIANRVVSSIEGLKDVGAGVDLIAQIYMGWKDPAQLSPYETRQVELVNKTFQFIKKDGQPNAQAIAESEDHLRLLLLLAPIVRERTTDLVGRLARLKGSDQADLRDVTLDLISYYLEAVLLDNADAAERIAFLDSFYADQRRVALYAVLRSVRKGFEDDIAPNLSQLYFDSTAPVVTESPGPGGTHEWRIEAPPNTGASTLLESASETARNRAGRLGSWLYDSYSVFAYRQQQGGSVYELPRSRSEVIKIPDPDLAAAISAEFLQLQIELPVLVLWRDLQDLLDAVATSDPQPGSPGDRTQWDNEILELIEKLAAELRRRDHEDFIRNSEALYQRAEDLHSKIYRATRRARMLRALGEQIPFLIVGGITSAAVGAWVLRATAGSRWLALLAEGATLTLFNGITAPASQRPGSVSGWIAQFGENVLLARLGQVVGAFLKGGRGMVTIRRLVLSVGGTLAANTLIQTTVQAIDQKAKGQGGESSFTEMLSINLVMNVIASFFGAAVHGKGRAASEENFLALDKPSQMTELKTAWKITDAAAERWLNLKQRSEQFQQRYERIGRAAREGKLTREEFDAFRDDGLDLANQLKQNLDLVEITGDPQTRQDVAASIDNLIDSLKHLEYSAAVRRPLELTTGFRQVGDGPTYTYDPAALSEERVQGLLQDAYGKDPDLSLSKLPGGGWEARNRGGRIVFQALPAGPRIAGLLPTSIEAIAEAGAPAQDPDLPGVDFAQGPKALEGLARVRSQPHAPELESVLADAGQGGGANRRAIVRLLQLVARGDANKAPDLWKGMSSYLRNGGSPRTLARVGIIPGDRTGNAAGRFRLLTGLGTEEVAGLEALFNIQPDLSGAKIGVLFDELTRDLGPILREINTLAPVAEQQGLRATIGQLLTGFRPGSRPSPQKTFISSQASGARGELAAAAEIAARSPGKLIRFQVPWVTPEGVLRIEDIAVIDPQTHEQTLGYEVKEITSAFLNERAAKQLAAYIARDAEASGLEQAAGVTRTYPTYSKFRFRIRGREIEAQAIKQLQREGSANPDATQINRRMEALIRPSLEPAFKDAEFTALPTDVQRVYRLLFEQKLSYFLEFF